MFDVDCKSASRKLWQTPTTRDQAMSCAMRNSVYETIVWYDSEDQSLKYQQTFPITPQTQTFFTPLKGATGAVCQPHWMQEQLFPTVHYSDEHLNLFFVSITFLVSIIFAGIYRCVWNLVKSNQNNHILDKTEFHLLRSMKYSLLSTRVLYFRL